MLSITKECRFSKKEKEKRIAVLEVSERKRKTTAKTPNNTSNIENISNSQVDTEIPQYQTIDSLDIAKLKLNARRLANRHRQRRFRELKRWKTVDEKLASINQDKFAKIIKALRAKNLTNRHYQHALLELRWAGSAIESLQEHVDANMLAESQVEAINRTDLDCYRSVIENVLARMTQEVDKLTHQKRSPDIIVDCKCKEQDQEIQKTPDTLFGRIDSQF